MMSSEAYLELFKIYDSAFFAKIVYLVLHMSHCVKSGRIRSYSGPRFSRIFPHSDWIRRDTEYLSVFSPNVRKCEKNADQNKAEYGHF